MWSEPSEAHLETRCYIERAGYRDSQASVNATALGSAEAGGIFTRSEDASAAST